MFVIDLASRRVQIVGSTPHPDGMFMRQVSRTLTATDGLLSAHRVLICDRDGKWSGDVRQLLKDAGVHVVRTSLQAPNANAYAERFVRSIKHECLNRMVPWASTMSDRLSRSLSIAAIASGITKDLPIGGSMGVRRGRSADLWDTTRRRRP